MASLTSCADCSAEIAPGLLACPRCARLLHGADLARLAGAAEAAERAGDLTLALASWRSALELLPARALQRATVHARMQSLSAAIDGRGKRPGVDAGAAGAGGGKKKTGIAAGVGAVGLLLVKSKALLVALLANGKLLLLGLLKLPTLLSMFAFLRFSTLGSVSFGLGTVACLYVHEVGHVATLRRYGIEASAPMFVPGVGAFVRMKQYPTDAHEDARTGLAGPAWGLVATLMALAFGLVARSETAMSVASFSAWLNLFNLTPFWQLDGARGLRALSRGERLVIAGLGAALGLVLHAWMPAVVGVVAGARAFQEDAHPRGDRRVLALFALLMVAHALVAMLRPFPWQPPGGP
jgi:Zn-dependent protease